MNTVQRINEIWPDQPDERHLHICVRLPGSESTGWSTYSLTNMHTSDTRTVLTKIPFAVALLSPIYFYHASLAIRSHKHSISELLDAHSRLKRTKPAQPPSALASSRNYERLQRLRGSQERILDDRPEPDRGIPPFPFYTLVLDTS